MLRDRKRERERWERQFEGGQLEAQHDTNFSSCCFQRYHKAQLETRSINLILLLIVQLVGVNEGELNTASCQFCDIKTMSFLILCIIPPYKRNLLINYSYLNLNDLYILQGFHPKN
jgi:hypothetical protein